MKKRYISLSLLSIFLIHIIFLSFHRHTKEKNEWRLVWKEDFNTSLLDTTVWSYRKRVKDGGGGWYLSSNPLCYDLNKGLLTIRSIINLDLITDTAKFLCGSLETRHKKAFSPGKLEIKARFNSISGAYSSIWLMPFTSEKGWPADGEIDIMEHSGKSDYVTQTIHTAYTRQNPEANPKRSVKVKIDSSKYNIYGVEILENEINFYINNKLTLSYPKIDYSGADNQFPFFRDWYLILNVPIKIKGSGELDPNSLPFEMKIDWVKYYQKSEERSSKKTCR